MHRTQEVLYNGLFHGSAVAVFLWGYTLLLFSPLKNDLLVRLLHGYSTDEDGKRYKEHTPLCPSPAFVLTCEASNDGSIILSAH